MAKTYGIGVMGAGDISQTYLRLAPLFKGLEIRAIAGVTIPLVDPSFTPDGAAGAVSDFSAAQFSSGAVPGNGRYIDHFPYLGLPHNGFDTPR